MRVIIQRCLEKNPGDRYQHAADVHLALQEMKEPLGSDPVKVRRGQIPTFPRRLIGRLPLVVIGLMVAAIAVYAIRSSRIGNAFSNAHGYSLLADGSFEQAIEQFQGVANESPNEANAWDSLGEGYLANGMPDEALEAYTRALTIDSAFEASILGRGLALAALGRYDEALEKASPDFRIQAFLLSRVGRYREAGEVLDKGRREDTDAEVNASALLTLAWMMIEQKQYARALEEVRAAERVLAGQQKHPMLVLADLIGGVAEIGAGQVQNAVASLTLQRAHHNSDDSVESKWVAALEAEIALAQGQDDRALSSFKAAQRPAWRTLGNDASTVFATTLPSRHGPARVEIARGNRAAAIEEYRRLTSVGPARRSSAALEPRDILELARLLEKAGDEAGARIEYERFLKLWANADAGPAGADRGEAGARSRPLDHRGSRSAQQSVGKRLDLVTKGVRLPDFIVERQARELAGEPGKVVRLAPQQHAL